MSAVNDELPQMHKEERDLLVAPIISAGFTDKKLNELIAKHNAFVILYSQHHHETLDTHYNTSAPKEHIV